MADPMTPSPEDVERMIETPRTMLAARLRSVGLEDDARALLAGRLMQVQTWVVLDMLAALSAALADARFRNWGNEPCNDPLAHRIDAALAKARGEA